MQFGHRADCSQQQIPRCSPGVTGTWLTYYRWPVSTDNWQAEKTSWRDNQTSCLSSVWLWWKAVKSEKLREERMLGRSGAAFALSELAIGRFKFLPQLTTILGGREAYKEDWQTTGKEEEHGGDVGFFLLSKLFSLSFLFFWDSEPSPKAFFSRDSWWHLSASPVCVPPPSLHYLWSNAFTFVCWGLFGLWFGSNGVYRPDHICCACNCGFLSGLPRMCWSNLYRPLMLTR